MKTIPRILGWRQKKPLFLMRMVVWGFSNGFSKGGPAKISPAWGFPALLLFRCFSTALLAVDLPKPF
jgi:hypothetical protein